MVAVRLPESALDYITSALNDAGGLAERVAKNPILEPVAFVPEDTEPELLEDFSSGGIMSQPEADAELALYLHFLKKRNGRLHSVVFDDPWSKPGDLDYAGPPPEAMAIIAGRINYAYDLAELTQELMWQYRATEISFLRIVYISEMTAPHIHELLESQPADLLSTLARSVRHVAVNAYNDESWIIADVAQAKA
ncbi:MAG TPA: hypothetical protein VMU01_14400 [Rhizomicrobium sp.]|nr:hypothetical protein [Rhizomicrobium sp.]